MSASPNLTVTYSTVGNVDIKLDVYYPEPKAHALPAVLFFHGGGLYAGQRDDVLVSWWLKDAALAQGWFFISADHRLLSPVTGHDQIADVVALSKFLTSAALAAHLPSGLALDPSSIFVSGASAGGYIARQFALYASPKPKAMFSFFGMGGDFLSDHWVKPNPEGIAFGGFVLRSAVEHLLSPNTPEISSGAPFTVGPSGLNAPLSRGKLYYWHLQEGTSLDGLTGKTGLGATLAKLPTSEERATALPEDDRSLFPQLRVAEYPPTILVHGTADTSVECQESEATYEALKKHGIKTELIRVEGAEHGLMVPGSVPPRPSPDAPAAYVKVIDFLAASL